MAASILTEDIAVEALRDFFREKPFLFFGTGMSCALDTRFGMLALKDVLVREIQHYKLTDVQRTEWDIVAPALQDGSDLEAALNVVSDQDLLKIITEITGSFVAKTDREFACRITQGNAEWPATRLLKKLVDTLPEGDRILHALTPNYDMLFEYACDYEGIPYANGFAGGIERKTDWNAVDCSLRSRERVNYGRKSQVVCKHKKHVRIYKVHGSLNYFFHRNAVIENNAWMWNPPDFTERVMITPGLSKYQTLQRYRQELLQSADTAINNATHFLFLGYGFNDNHLEEYIKRKLITQSCNGLIVTRNSNPRIEALLSEANNLWLVCKSEDANSVETRIFNRQYSGWLRLPAKRLWDICEFTTQILGG
ncbi:MAG: SIR2 family protein [Desulfobacterales bacterium]|nr:SIR2 family protein [Desulfobacterales bacterium]